MNDRADVGKVHELVSKLIMAGFRGSAESVVCDAMSEYFEGSKPCGECEYDDSQGLGYCESCVFKTRGSQFNPKLKKIGTIGNYGENMR